jgi:GTP-binding protein
LSLPRIAVVGRQNVGKSTLVNRLSGVRQAIAGDEPGVTRDRVEVEASWRGIRFVLIDTGGYVTSATGIERVVAQQAALAAEGADLVLLVLDAKAEITEEDASLARRLHRTSASVLVVANKVDYQEEAAESASFISLGLGEAVPLSALHGTGAGDLLDLIVSIVPRPAESTDPSEEPRFAIVGRPNVGKSSLFNRLVGEDRSVVFESAGTTRDPVDALVRWEKGPVRFVDTAGMRRSIKTKGVEYHSLVRAKRAIVRADVVALVMDATEPFTSEDKKIASTVLDAGRALLFVANKWDLVEERRNAFDRTAKLARSFVRAPLHRTSATTGLGIGALPDALLRLRQRWISRAPTARVNEIVRDAVGERPPPRGVGAIRYSTQVSSGPPTFALFAAGEPDASYRRFIEGRLRGSFDLDGVPIRLKFRGRQRKGG